MNWQIAPSDLSVEYRQYEGMGTTGTPRNPIGNTDSIPSDLLQRLQRLVGTRLFCRSPSDSGQCPLFHHLRRYRSMGRCRLRNPRGWRGWICRRDVNPRRTDAGLRPFVLHLPWFLSRVLSRPWATHCRPRARLAAAARHGPSRRGTGAAEAAVRDSFSPSCDAGATLAVALSVFALQLPRNEEGPTSAGPPPPPARTPATMPLWPHQRPHEPLPGGRQKTL